MTEVANVATRGRNYAEKAAASQFKELRMLLSATRDPSVADELRSILGEK